MAVSISRCMISSFESGRLELHFFQPLLQKRELGTFLRELGEVRLLEEFLNRVAPVFDLFHGVGKFSFTEKNGSLGARVHHDDVGAELLEGPDHFVAIGVAGDKIEQVEVALRVANDALEIVDLKKTEVAVVILDAFLLQLGALLRREMVGLAAFFGTLRATLMIDEQAIRCCAGADHQAGLPFPSEADRGRCAVAISRAHRVP